MLCVSSWCREDGNKSSKTMQVLNVTCKEDKSVCSSLVSLFLAVRRVLGTEQAVS